ncbi:uncharacterized protein ACOB6Z_009843 [Ctenodactylus gundi]
MLAWKSVLNQSGPTEFVFRVFTTVPELQTLLFLLSLLLYLLILCGNTAIVWVVSAHRSLRTPMYFFLCNLSFLEICYTSVVVPLMLSNVFGAQRPIPLAGCAAQMFFFVTLGSTDCFLLAVMAYDRYVAICHPLHYTLIMTRRVCVRMVAGSVGLAVFLSLQLTALIFTLPFCGRRREINHFLCDVPPVLRLACADIRVHQAVLYVVGILVLMVPFLLICVSYVSITAAILRIHSAEGRQRAFSTCSSHLTMVLLQYGCCSLVYLRPRSSTSEDEDRHIALVYTFVTPLLNPLIYTLRNKDVKGALRSAVLRKITLMGNRTEVTEFILLGLTDDPDLQVPLFVTFLLIYAITVAGNLGMVLLILLDSRLHTPMYFFLWNLSLVDFCSSSAVTPTIMAGLLVGDQVISHHACATQMFLFAMLIGTENYLLASMAYDRYAAVCKPLHYTTIMTTRVCACLITGCYVLGLLNASIHVGNTFSLSFCQSSVVHHFFCDIPAVMVVSCSDRHVSDLVLVYSVSFHIFFALLVIWVSYIFIFVTVLKMRSSAGPQKALSTCASHLTAVSIFYGTAIFMYLQPSSSHSMDTDKITSVFYTILIPMLNPAVYSLRNKEVKRGFFKRSLMGNRTEVTEFILLGLTNDPDLRVPLFVTFLLIYAVTVAGNLGMVLLILLDSRLHTPMYFFLGNLSLVDLCYSSTVTPTVMAGLLGGDQVISYNACAAQMFFFGSFSTVESYLLASMAYDRYAAVCKPLHYTATMTPRVCACLITGSYICGFLNASIHTGDTFSLSFCGFNIVHHFFCDIPAVMVLSCSDRHVGELVLVYVVGFNIFFALLAILISYTHIFLTILKLRSSSGHGKALSTCASHLTAVSIFYGTVIFVYLQPSSHHSMDTDKVSSVFYTMVVPMLNPLVYSLKNREVRSAFTKIMLEAK